MDAPHRFDPDRDACRCGGEWVYFDDERTHGCEVAGAWAAVDPAVVRNGRALTVALDHHGRAHCGDCAAIAGIGPCDLDGARCEACALDCACAACVGRRP